MATPTREKDTCPKVLIRGELRKVPDSYPNGASAQWEHDQQFINELTKQTVIEQRVACWVNTNPSAKPKSPDTKS